MAHVQDQVSEGIVEFEEQENLACTQKQEHSNGLAQIKLHNNYTLLIIRNKSILC